MADGDVKYCPLSNASSRDLRDPCQSDCQLRDGDKCGLLVDNETDRIDAARAANKSICPLLRDACQEDFCPFWKLIWTSEGNVRACILAKACFKIATGELI